MRDGVALVLKHCFGDCNFLHFGKKLRIFEPEAKNIAEK